VRRTIEALNTRDVPAALELFDPDVEVDWSRSRGPLAGVYHGHDGLRHVWDELWDAFEEVRFVADELIPVGPNVLAPNTTHVRGRDGVELSVSSTLVYTVSGGRVVRVRLFQDLADARAAISRPR